MYDQHGGLDIEPVPAALNPSLEVGFLPRKEAVSQVVDPAGDLRCGDRQTRAGQRYEECEQQGRAEIAISNHEAILPDEKKSQTVSLSRPFNTGTGFEPVRNQTHEVMIMSLYFRTVSAVLAALATLGLIVSSASAQELSDAPVAVEFNLVLSQSALLAGQNETLAMVEIKASEGVDTTRSAVSLAIVVDASGSMRGDKMEHAQESAHRLIDQLQQGDRITVISYDTRVTTHLASFEIGADRAVAHVAVDRIEARGNTCISCGIEAGYAALHDAPYAHVRRVVMLSDGNANRGTTDSDSLGEQAATALQASRSVTSTIGIGTDYNEEILSAISAGGSGAFYFLPDPASISTILERELASLASTVATNVAVELRPGLGATLGDSSSLGATQEGNALLFNLGQVSAGDIRRLVVPIQLEVGAEGAVVHGTATFTPVGSESVAVEMVGLVMRTDDPEAADTSRNNAVLEHAERLEAAADIELAIQEFRSGDTDAARDRLSRRQRQLNESASAFAAPTLSAEAAEVDELLDALEEEDMDEERSREIYLQNRSRGDEIRSGRPTEQMYHQEMLNH